MSFICHLKILNDLCGVLQTCLWTRASYEVRGKWNYTFSYDWTYKYGACYTKAALYTILCSINFEQTLHILTCLNKNKPDFFFIPWPSKLAVQALLCYYSRKAIFYDHPPPATVSTLLIPKQIRSVIKSSTRFTKMERGSWF